jgi:hypothetical protein
MSFDLQDKPLVGKLTEVFPGKTIRELPYRELRDVMAKAPEDWRAEAIAAASLGVSLDDLLGLPGRYAGAVSKLLAAVTELHGLNDATEKPPVNGTTVADGGESVGKH